MADPPWHRLVATVVRPVTDPLRGATAAVHLIALAAVALAPASLYVVLLVYWADSLCGVVRRVCQTVVAAPREAYSPTEPPAVQRNGDASPLRFLTPKLGTVQPVGLLPPVAVHNLKPAVMGTLGLGVTGLIVGATVTTLRPPFEVFSPPTVWLFAAAGLAVGAKQLVAFDRFRRSDRPPVARLSTAAGWLAAVGFAVPVVVVDTVYAGASFDPTAGFAALAVVLVAARVVVGGDAEPTGGDPFELTPPPGRPTARFGADSRAVWVAGLLDGVVPRIEWDVFAVLARVGVVVLAGGGGFLAAGTAGLRPTAAAVVGLLAVIAVLVGGFGLVGVVHYELAFGAMEYRLYDEELVAYDRRLEAVQWRVPLDEITAVSIHRGLWHSPPGSDAAAVRLDRSDQRVEQPPYGTYRTTLAYVQRPATVRDRLQRAIRRSS